MIFKVTKQFSRGPETTLQSFKEYNKAVEFIQERLAEDIRFKVQAKYAIYEFDEVVKEFTQADAVAPASSGQSAFTSGKSQASTFNPTPFNAQPSPFPRSGFKDTDDKNKDK